MATSNTSSALQAQDDSDLLKPLQLMSTIMRSKLYAGIITTVVGNGEAGNSGDGGPAIHASLTQPAGIAVDGFGTLYIADYGAHVIRAVTADGTIRTVAGTGQAGFNGDGAKAVEKMLNKPASLAVTKSGDLYVADSGNNRIRRITPNNAISTIAGTGVAGTLGDGGSAIQAQLYDRCCIRTRRQPISRIVFRPCSRDNARWHDPHGCRNNSLWV
jgi:hypothetical protein